MLRYSQFCKVSRRTQHRDDETMTDAQGSRRSGGKSTGPICGTPTSGALVPSPTPSISAGTFVRGKRKTASRRSVGNRNKRRPGAAGELHVPGPPGDPPNCRGNRADVVRARRREGAGAFRARHRRCPRAEGKVLGAARGDERGSAVARSGQTTAGPRSSRPTYGGFTEGFSTPDLKDAKASLDEVAQ